MDLLLKTATIFLLTFCVECNDNILCDSPQYLELGKRGVVECRFPDTYYGILWYNTTDFLSTDPIAHLTNSNDKREQECESSQYCIDPSGFLVINNVSLQQDCNFTVIVLNSTTDRYSPNNIHVVVTVRPQQSQPHVDGCNENEKICFKKMNTSSKLYCRVTEARPSVDLHWFIKTTAGDIRIHSDREVTFYNSLYTTITKTMYTTSNTSTCVVYVCKATSRPSLLRHEFSLVVVQRDLDQFEAIERGRKNVQQSTSTEIFCTEPPFLYLVWTKHTFGNLTEDLIEVLSTNGDFTTRFHSTKYDLIDHAALGIGKVSAEDEGLYICISGDGITESVKMFNLEVYVLPDPGYPVIEGCSHQRQCTLFVNNEGSLACSLKGIRPEVKLRWEVIEDYHKSFISFSNDDCTIRDNGFTSDIHCTSDFRIHAGVTGRFAIRCTTWDFGDIPFNLSTQAQLLLLQETGDVNIPEGVAHGDILLPIIVVIILAASTVVIVIVVRRSKSSTTSTDEGAPLMDINRPHEEKIRIFKDELKVKYKETWETVCPLPYNKNVKYKINDIFIEGEIERLEKVVHSEVAKFYIWRKLESHNDFLDPSCQSRTKLLLEGEPGYGKTTLGYQLAYDWSHSNPNSPLRDIDLYILLRLRYIKNISSIPYAVKKFLLPANSSLTVKDVANILYHSESVVIYLDGFNRYSCDEYNIMNDVYSNNICSKCQVIVTTKPFCLPDEHAESTKRMRLTGFGEANWRQYLQKSVVRGDLGEEERIMKMLCDNPFLRDLCQVPLFFVLFAHISADAGTFSGGELKSVTSFYQNLVDVFHSKMESCEVDEHVGLSNVCFNGLLREEKGLIWKKDEMHHALGQTLYRAYRGVGILVEKQFSIYNATRQSYEYEQKVRFVHDVFCEWYAAHKLVQVITMEQSSEEECKKYFEKINPHDHQYVYRFACGINSRAAKKIINYIHTIKDGEKFAILCILEQTKNFDRIEDIIRNICSSPVSINAYDTLFLQRSTVQLLQFASNKGINIECVWLGQMNSILDDDKQSLELSSGLFLPKIPTLRQLVIRDPDRRMTKQEFVDFFHYTSFCPSLKDLRFRACLLPFLQPGDLDGNILDGKEVDVQWEIPVLERKWYSLDFPSGLWKHKGLEMSRADYDRLVPSFNKSFNTGEESGDVPNDAENSSLMVK